MQLRNKNSLESHENKISRAFHMNQKRNTKRGGATDMFLSNDVNDNELEDSNSQIK